jgi:hypothetical protein
MSLTTEGLVGKMTSALKMEYNARKGKDLPPGYEEDREILFAAIARGILEYFGEKQDEFISSVTFTDGGISEQHTVTKIDLNITP